MADRLRILVVDDHDADRAAVARALAEADIDCERVECRSGAEAIETLRHCVGANTFDCVLMDTELPDRPGLQVLQALRGAGGTSGTGGGGTGASGVPIIMMTGQGSEQLAVDLMKAGAADYLSKGRVSTESLARSIRTAVRVSRAERAAARAAAELREQTAVAQALHRIGTRLAAERDVQRLVQLVTDEATTMTGAGFGAFFYNVPPANDRGESYMLYTISGVPRESFEQFPMPRNTEIFAPTFSGTGTVRLDDVTKDPRYGKNAPHHGMPTGHLPVRSYLAVPVISRSGAVIGGLFFGHPNPGRFSESDEKLVESIAAQAAVAIDNARLNDALRRGEEHYRFMADAVPQMLWTAGPDGKTDYFNRRWLDYTGLTLEGSAAGAGRIALHPDDLATCLRLWDEAVRSGTEFSMEYRLLRASDHAYRWHLARAVPMRDDSGDIIKWFGSCTDIHDQKTAAAALAAANNAKDQFLAVLSHELRTPLMPVLLTVQSLQDRPQIPSAEMNDALDVIRRNVELEARLIDDLLDLTRVSKGKLQLNFDTVDVHAALRSAMDICSVDIVAKQLGTTMDLAATRHHVRGDMARLQQVFWNLIKNAIKFTPAHGHITVHTYDDPAGPLKIAVTDTGIGIDPESVTRIFDAFEQADQSVTRQFGGLGLGLAISKALVDLHGGELTASSAGPGKGATFTVQLRPTAATAPVKSPLPAGVTDLPPISAAAAAAAENVSLASPPAELSAAAPVTPIQILLVDDHQDTNRAMARLLEQMGYHVRTADSVRAALAVAEEQLGQPSGGESTAHGGRGGFDLLISDIGLPDGSGLDLMRELLARHPRRPIKGIALSGFGMEEDIRRSKEAGFYEHLTKPINFKRLERAIRELTSA